MYEPHTHINAPILQAINSFYKRSLYNETIIQEVDALHQCLMLRERGRETQREERGRREREGKGRREKDREKE